MTPFSIPADFRAFMQKVVTYLDTPGERFLDAEDALSDEVGHGGRIDGADTYRFVYITADGQFKWELIVKEGAIRAIAGGMVDEIEGERIDLVRTHGRAPFGEALMIWGEYGDDALKIRNHRELITALDLLHESAQERPVMLRLWSRCDDQVIAALSHEVCALYVIESVDGYGTSSGDPRLRDAFEVIDHDGKPFAVPLADCIPWDRARNALLQFYDHGNLGPEIKVEGRIPSVLLMLGDVDRKAALAARAEAPRELSRSSIPRLVQPAIPMTVGDERTEPVDVDAIAAGDAPMPLEALSAWARRLIELLHARELIEMGPGNLDEITYQLGGLLQAHGAEAEHSLDTAEWLANEIGAVRGIDKLFATGGDLQIALRRSREGL